MQKTYPQTHSGRVALITGAAGALGSHFARRLAAAGCDLALTDLTIPEQTIESLAEAGVRVYADAVDLADADAVAGFAHDVLAHYGQCDILVNNAAYMPLIPFEELTLQEFRKFEAINVEASLVFAQQLAPRMKERGYGRIVQIGSSTTGDPRPGFAGYITTKMAGIGFVRALAAEFGNCGITVNAIHPGLTATESSRKHLPQALFDAVKDLQLIKRTEVPEDLVGVLAFLTSEEAGFITGQALNVDGGTQF
ncbi:SDR family NAD(P)-dependent oxidoreductase [Oceanobacter mangrovi]|uniref:SDR family NAD(P)-dependent oxidoreductase n=1 Tax=Oceanobacter mangrovi TaxID=2862510 RepID=UPI001C8D68C7|nr:SDR family oxidoreductase [Oceanobacter mangrovi]